MLEWFTAKSLFGAPRWIFAALAIAAFVAVVAIINHGVSSSIETISSVSSAQGAAVEQTKGLEKVLQRTEEGNAVRGVIEDQAARGGGSELYDQCMRSNRGAAEICQRFLPERPAADGQRGPESGAGRPGQ